MLWLSAKVQNVVRINHVVFFLQYGSIKLRVFVLDHVIS